MIQMEQKEPNLLKRYFAWRRNRLEAERIKYEKMSSMEKLISWVKTFANAIVVVTIINGLALASFVVPTGSMEDTVLTGEFLFVNKFIFGPSTPQIIPFFEIPLPYYKTPPIRDPKQGDVIVFIFPGNREEVESSNFTYYLKRCVAVSGDMLEVKNRKVLVNDVEMPLPTEAKFDESGFYDQEIDKQYTFPVGRGFSRDNWGPMRIPKQGDVIQLTSTNYLEWETFIRREGHMFAFNNGSVLVDGKPTTSYTVERDYVFGMGDNRNNSLDSRYWGFIPKQDVVGTPMVVYWSWIKRIQQQPGDLPDFSFGEKFKSLFSEGEYNKNARIKRIGTIIK